MSETETTGATESGSADTGSSSAPTEIREKAWDAIQRSPDGKADDYVAEKTDREAEERGDPVVNNPHRKQERLERWQRALQRATEVDGNKAPAADGPQQAEATETYDRDEEVRQIRVDAQFELRAKQFEEKQPDFEKTVREVFSVFPPSDVLKNAIRESPLGPEVAYLFANNPEAIQEFNALPPAQALRIVGAIEGRLAHERAAGQQAPQEVSQRRTRAPAPIKPLSGGAASPTKDPTKMSTPEYVAWRKSGGGGKRAF